MKLFRLAALAGTSLLAMTAHASADPISIGSFVISSLLSIGAGGILPAVSAATIGNIVIGAAFVGAQIASSFLSRPKVKPQEYKNNFETGESSEIRAVGRVRIGGLRAFGNTTGRDRYRLTCHTKGIWTATENYYLGGREVTVDTDGSVSSPPWSRPNDSYVTIKSKRGDGTETAWPELIAAFPDLWTSAHLVRGIFQSLVKYVSPGLTSERFLKLYQQGEPPLEIEGRAEPVYDPRTGTTVWRDSGPLVAAHILRAYPSLNAGDLDYTLIGAEATKGEALVATKTGTEARSRCWGIWPSESPRGDIMQQVLESIGAEIVPTDDNRYAVRLIDDVRVPEIKFTKKHILEIDLKSGPESVERPNVCRVSYYSPERNYEVAEIDMTGIAWARVQSEIDRVGEQILDVELPFCPSASQAQRIARRLFALARADAGIMTLNFAGTAAWGLSTAEIELPDLDQDAICAIASPRVNDEQGTVEIPFVVWPTLAPWNPAIHEAAAPEPIPELQFESELPTPIAPTAASLIIYPNASREVRVRLTPVSGATIAEATYRRYVGGEPTAWMSMDEPSLALAITTADLEGQQVDFRVRYFNSDDEASYNSPALAIASLAVDNTQTAAPSMSGVFDNANNTLSVTVVAPASFNVARVLVERNVSGTTWTPVLDTAVRPGQVFNLTYGSSVTLRARAYTSGGVASPISNYSYGG